MKLHVSRCVLFFLLFLVCTGHQLLAQVGANTNPDKNAVLDLTNSKNKGFLAPQVRLTQAISPVPVALSGNLKYGMLVYNNNTDTAGNGLKGRGYYYWDSTGVGTGKWCVVYTNNNTAPTSTGWLLTGNAGTSADGSVNFVGTTDNAPLKFRVNNQPYGFLGGRTNGYGWFNVAMGRAAMNNVTTGSFNSAFGDTAMIGNVSGSSNSAFGMSAMSLPTASSNNSAFGAWSLKYLASGNFNSAFGAGAFTGKGPSGSTASYNNAFGASALNINQGNSNNAFGYQALALNTTGANNIAFGYQAGYNMTTGSNNILVGGSMTNIINASSPIASYEMNIGNTLFGLNVDSTIGVGKIGVNTRMPLVELDVNGQARVRNLPQGAVTDSVVTADLNGNLRWRAASSLSGNNWTLLGNTGTTAANFLGTTDNTPFFLRINNTNAGSLSQNNTAYGYNAYNTTADPSAVNNTALGVTTLLNNITGIENTAVGSGALKSNTTGGSNIAIGIDAMGKNTTGNYNAIVGYQAMTNGVFAGNYNAAFGYQALFNNAGGNHNIALGEQAGYGLKDGNLNIYLGYRAGYTTTDYHGNNNIMIGAETAPAAAANNDEINIGNAIYGLDVNSTVKGFKSAKIGINVQQPTNAFHVVPKTIGTDDPVRIEGLRTGTAADSLVTADATGNLHKRTTADVMGSVGWLLKGNAGTDSSKNFIGTMDNNSLMFRVNNTRAGVITSAWDNTGLGYQALQSIAGGGTSLSSAQGNTGIGSAALSKLVSAGNGNNTAVGYGALYSTVNGVANTAVGAMALANYTGTAGTNGSRNTAVGYLAMSGSSTLPLTNNNGAFNTALGVGAMNNSITYITGSYNVALGASALNNSAASSYNIAIGPSAIGGSTALTNAANCNIAIGPSVMSNLASGSNNIAIGLNAGNTLTTGKSNIFIGGGSVNTIIGSSATASYEMNIGNTLFGTNVDSTIGIGKVGVNTRTPLSTLQVNGSVSVKVFTVTTATYTVADNDYIIRADGSVSQTITLPSAVAFPGRLLIIRYGGTTAAWTPTYFNVVTNGTDKIGPNIVVAPTATSVSGQPTLNLFSDGVNWFYY